MQGGYTYIDGFNLYHGLEESGLRQCYWLDLRKLADKILASYGYASTLIRYFTTRVANNHPGWQSQDTWLSAVRTMQPDVRIEWGQFQREQVVCQVCGASFTVQREKKTDVNIGVKVMEDLAANRPSAVVLITGDADQVPTVAALKRWDNQFPVIVAFPPRRSSDHLREVAGRKKTIALTPELLMDCCLPDEVNEYIKKPVHWCSIH